MGLGGAAVRPWIRRYRCRRAEASFLLVAVCCSGGGSIPSGIGGPRLPFSWSQSVAAGGDRSRRGSAGRSVLSRGRSLLQRGSRSCQGSAGRSLRARRPAVLANMRALRRLRPEGGAFSAAARSRPLAEGCHSPEGSMRLRSAAGRTEIARKRGGPKLRPASGPQAARTPPLTDSDTFARYTAGTPPCSSRRSAGNPCRSDRPVRGHSF